MQNLWKATVCSSAAAGFSTQINKWVQCCRSFMRMVFGEDDCDDFDLFIYFSLLYGILWIESVEFDWFTLIFSHHRSLRDIYKLTAVNFSLSNFFRATKVWLKNNFSCSENIFLSWAVSLTVVLQICQRMRKKERKIRLHQTMEYGWANVQLRYI